MLAKALNMLRWLPESALCWLSGDERCATLKMCMVPLSDVQVRYLFSKSKAKSLMVVGVLPRLNSPSFLLVVGSKILTSVP